MHTTLAWQLCLLIVQTNAFTHWIVTENGRIEPKLDTHFYMRRPYDLIALLDQEKRRDELDALVEDMEKQRNLIDNKSLQSRFMYECEKVPKDIPNSIVASNASDRVLYTLQPAEPHVKVEAICTRFHYLPFSIRAFEHLDAMRKRKESKEETCEDCLPEMNWEAVGPTIVSGLEANNTSWVHYNLGILYWWRLGNLYEAIECARRALHFAPLEYIDIPLANLGNLLSFHGDKLEDALTVIRAAIDHAPYEEKYYLLLGEAYIHKGDFESGVKYFEKFKTLYDARGRREQGIHGQLDESAASAVSISCILKALIGMKEYQDMLQGILSDLHDFHAQQQRWLSIQERYFWEIAPHEFKVSLALDEEHVASSLYINTYKGFKDTLEELLGSYKDKIGKTRPTSTNIYKELVPLKEAKEKRNEEENLIQKYPTSMNVPDNLYFDSSKWPTKEECVDWNLPLGETEDLNFPIVLPPENKGYDIIRFLTTDIDVKENEDHPLPWYPPVCETSGYDYVAKFLPDEIKNIVDKNKPLPVDKLFKSHFLNYINNGNSNEAEIGQRIVSAMKTKKAPAWTLAILANMYWRIRGNTRNAIHCLSMYVEPMAGSTDVAFVSMGSMLYQMGLIENALKFANLAARVNFNEPSTNFLLAVIYYKKQNPLKALFYLKKVLRVDSGYYNGEAERLLKLWECRIKLGEYEFKLNDEQKTGDVCIDTSRVEGVICSPNGEQCKTAAIQCFKSEKKQKVEVAVTKPMESKHCGGSIRKSTTLTPGLLVPSIMHSETDAQDFLMKILFGDDNEVLTHATATESTLGDFYVSVALTEDPVSEVMLNVYDKSGTYLLSKTKCNDIKDADWLHYTSLWETFASRNINIAPYLTPLHRPAANLRPHCLNTVKPGSPTLDQITATMLLRRLPNIPEEGIAEWLGLMASDLEASVAELGAKIGAALKDNNTSWILATAAALYWRIVGNTEEAVTCIRQALTYVPPDMTDIPLMNLASILQKLGHLNDALEVIELAMQANPKFVVNHFHAGNIYTSLGDYEKAVAMYRTSLALDFNFEPARNRLQAILCTLLFDETRTIGESSDS